MGAGTYWHAKRTAAEAMKRFAASDPHATRREQDEMVCRCGRRWPIGEKHP